MTSFTLALTVIALPELMLMLAPSNSCDAD